MPQTILIVDDDADFNGLLKVVFQQADYCVKAFQDPREALRFIAESHVDLIVTDYEMPFLNGRDYLRRIKQTKPEIPVLMVSAYLDDVTIRELLREGINGVFQKPLNVFALLARTKELMSAAVQEPDSAGTSEPSPSSVAAVTQEALGFPFASFACLHEETVDFARSLYRLKDFRSALTLVGPLGTHFRQICEDMHGFADEPALEYFMYLDKASLLLDQVKHQIKRVLAEGAQRVTCVFTEADAFSPDQWGFLKSLPTALGGSQTTESRARFIFCVSRDLDTLYAEQLIDDKLYMFMGAAEVFVPALNQCPKDVELLARNMALQRIDAETLNTAPEFEAALRERLQAPEWPQHYDQLHATVCELVATILDTADRASRHAPTARPKSGTKTRVTRSKRRSQLPDGSLI